ncbi:hypothetical protein BZARG_940 [Bizionia argentinensis JUB59]|uniref:Selenophosphate synthetase n=1 Tax=Bizionia argentinensis JUB59 TaxID=1046627 RepID=G2EBR1_9FLAO|nr:hypothetical protein [Bizionia argentinensis]EGV44108.1 hypothetical protein BZARG_940 [Bizionia argentinensis JUB59]
MKPYILLFSIVLFMQSCKSDKNNTSTIISDENTLTVSEKIAQAYGVKNWDDVNTITFSFNVKKDSTVFKRSWEWSPKTNDVKLMTDTDTLNYNRNQVDSTSINADKSFINDKFWLLAPFNLFWDSGTTVTDPVIEKAPISEKMLNKITLTYTNEGGYTPGDAYDFYYNDDFLVEEWIYRKGNSVEPSMITTWENDTDFKGVLLALNHKKMDDDWELYFTDVTIK